MNSLNTLKFKEKQKFTQWWLWLIMLGAGLITAWGVYRQLILGVSFGDKPMSDTGLIIFSIFTFSLVALIGMMRLSTKIDEKEIQMSFFPFVKKRINWSEVKSAKVLDYGFIGGWGIRLWTKYGTVYNMSGNKGLFIELLNGKQFIIGTQKEKELSEILKKINKS